MPDNYNKKRSSVEKSSTIAGFLLALVSHALLIGICAFSGLKYLYPPPPEQSMLIEFVEIEEAEAPKPVIRGQQPRAVNANPQEDINLVQKSQAQLEGTKANEAPEATVGEDGDVEVPEPPRKVEINKRALFHAANNESEKDTLAPQTADKASDKLKAGHASGNTMSGKLTGEPNAKVKGRNVVGTIARPNYSVQSDGIVVVDIIVDRSGNVTSAIPGGTGTTLTDKTLWAEARKAAMATKFSAKAEDVPSRPGTITYVFKLTQ